MADRYALDVGALPSVRLTGRDACVAAHHDFDIAWRADSDGRVLFLHMDQDGQYLRDYMLVVPRLGVRWDWYVGHEW